MEKKYNYTSNSSEINRLIANKHFEIYLNKTKLRKEEVENKKYINWIKSNMQRYRQLYNLKDGASLYKESAEDFISFLEKQ